MYTLEGGVARGGALYTVVLLPAKLREYLNDRHLERMVLVAMLLERSSWLLGSGAMVVRILLVLDGVAILVEHLDRHLWSAEQDGA